MSRQPRLCAITMVILLYAGVARTAYAQETARPERRLTTTRRKTFDWAIEQARGFLAKEPLIAHPRPSEIQCRAEVDIVTPADTVVDLIDHVSGQPLGMVILEAPDPTPIAFAWHTREYVDLRETSLLSVEQAQSIAADVVLRHWPDAPVSGLARETGTRPITREGRYSFGCSRFVHGVQALSVSVGIRAWDGKLGAFYTYRHPDPGSIPPPSFSEAEVRRRLLDAACRKLKCSQEALRAVTVKRKCFPQDKGELYGWELSAWLPGDPRVAIVHAYLVEPGGTVDGVEVRWEPRAPSPAPAWDATCARYAWPSWSADGKAIVSQAGDVRWAGYPPWDSSIPQSVVVSDLATARTFLLRPLREVGWPSLYYWDPPTAWTSERLVLPVGYRHQLLVLNLLSGETRLCSLSDYAEVKSSVAVQGDLVCVACQAWSADADIAVASLQASSDEKVQLRPLRLPGTDSNPIFAPGDACIYFAHAAPGKEAEKASWEILRARVTDGPALAPPEPVVTGLGCVGRMSFFPNGRRLLVWHGDKLDVVDVEARTRTPLDLPALHDPDLPADCPALWLRDPAVSPDGTRLAFSGYRDSGDPEHGTGFHIYLCRFDGSDLKRLTPLVDVPVEPYVYPQTGKTALDVVRETALVQ